MRTHRQTYGSLAEFARAAAAAGNPDTATDPDLAESAREHGGDHWAGGTFAEALTLASEGWADGVTEASPLVDSALALVETETETSTFHAYHAVAGSEVDIGAYLMGEPECMVEYEPATVSRAGRVVTLCASVVYSGAVSPEDARARGASIVALTMALEQTGHAVELWADMASVKSGYRCETRVLVKGAHDRLDPATVAYAFAHPSMLRRLMFADWLTMPKGHIAKVVRTGYGSPAEPARDLPDGTIYLPSLNTGRNAASDGPRMVLDTLRELGLAE